MKIKALLYLAALALPGSALCQTNPAILNWLQNTSQTGTYYMQGNSTAVSNGIQVNC